MGKALLGLALLAVAREARAQVPGTYNSCE